MEDITKLITLDEDESILGIFPEPSLDKIKIEYLSKKYHHIEDLPQWFFHIDEKYISYTFTHVFTNKRYIAIGLNFWQITKPIFMEMAEKIKIQNYILSIPREALVSFNIDIGFITNIISLGNLVKLNCGTNNFYLQIKEFLIEKWEYSASEFEEMEDKNLSKLKKNIFLSNIIEYVLLSFRLIRFYSILFIESHESEQNPLFFILWVLMSLLCICAIGTIIKSITIGINLRKKKAFLSIPLKGSLFGWFIIVLMVFFLTISGS